MKNYCETKIDEIGRIIIPDELMEYVNHFSPEVEIDIVENHLELKLRPLNEERCDICGIIYHNGEKLDDYNGTKICTSCIQAIQNDELLPIKYQNLGQTGLIENNMCFIPETFRKTLGLRKKPKLNVYLNDENDTIIFKPILSCLNCGKGDVLEFGNIYLCSDCLKELEKKHN